MVPSCRHTLTRARASAVGREFVVVLSTQMAYAYEDGVLQRSARISSGLPDTPTVKGDFKIRRKVRRQRMTGRGLRSGQCGMGDVLLRRLRLPRHLVALITSASP